ncbi:MAG: hypothetical protein FWD17_04720, partial [Polyangiaceae bacterium]|nr:hypothetical protein [Polyangiaceae bacterium]
DVPSCPPVLVISDVAVTRELELVVVTPLPAGRVLDLPSLLLVDAAPVLLPGCSPPLPASGEPHESTPSRPRAPTAWNVEERFIGPSGTAEMYLTIPKGRLELRKNRLRLDL